MVDLIVPILILVWGKWLIEGRYVYNQLRFAQKTRFIHILLMVTYFGWGVCFGVATYFLLMFV
jgi:hypothetical protein